MSTSFKQFELTPEQKLFVLKIWIAGYVVDRITKAGVTISVPVAAEFCSVFGEEFPTFDEYLKAYQQWYYTMKLCKRALWVDEPNALTNSDFTFL